MFDLEKIEDVKTILYQNDTNSQIRIDKFLSDQFKDYSRSYFQKLMDLGLITVNFKIIKKSSFLLKNGDQIVIKFPEVKQFDLSPKQIDFQVISVQPDFIVVNKPAGLIVHHSGKTQESEVTLVNGLLYKFQELNKFSNKERPGIVHRLDKDTSGLLLVARNTISQIGLSRLFKSRKIKKIYLAVVKGHPLKKGKIDYPISRHAFKRHMMTHTRLSGKKALTYYKVLEYFKDSALVACRIVTGRTHQIRVHFAAIGHGLLGDKVYGYESKIISRQALHSYKISFEYRNNKYKFKAEIPKDIKDLIKNLRG